MELKTSLPEKIRDLYAERIREGRLPPGTRLPSVRALAGELGVSAFTAQTGLRLLCRTGMAYSIPGKGMFVSEGKCRKRMIVFAYDKNNCFDSSSSFASELFRELSRQAEPFGIEICPVTISSLEKRKEETEDQEIIGATYSIFPERFATPFFRSRNIPVVVFAEEGLTGGLDYVIPDNYGSGWRLAELLYQYGHRRTVFISSFQGAKENVYNRHSRQRIAGHADFYTFHGMAPPEIIPWNVTKKGGKTPVYRLLSALKAHKGKNDLPTAAVIGSYTMAGEIQRFAEHELEIDDLFSLLSVATFGVRYENPLDPEPGGKKFTYMKHNSRRSAEEILSRILRHPEAERTDDSCRSYISMILRMHESICRI